LLAFLMGKNNSFAEFLGCKKLLLVVEDRAGERMPGEMTGGCARWGTSRPLGLSSGYGQQGAR